MNVAALYVETGRHYGLPDVDPWDEERDARLYAGPHRWSRTRRAPGGRCCGTRCVATRGPAAPDAWR